MPGIFGYFDPLRELPESLIDEMARAFGKSSEQLMAIERGSKASFGIINYSGTDLILGDMSTSRYTVFGQFDSLSSDESSLSHAAIAKRCLGGEGIDDIEHIRGTYLAVVMDYRSDSLTLINDRFASQPLYLCQRGSVCFFASQVKAIMAVLPVAAEIDRESVATMLSIGEVIGNRTLVKGIETLPAASVLTLNPLGVKKHRYWQYSYKENLSANWQDAVQRTGKSLVRALARGIKHTSSIAVPLSGGLDSRFLLDLACQQGRHPATYTWGIKGCRDIVYAQDVADRLRCPHESFMFRNGYLSELADRGVWLTEGHIPATNFHVLPYVDILASRGHDLLLDGFAGDGVLGGNFISNAWLKSSDMAASARSLWNWRRNGFDGFWSHSDVVIMHEQAGQIFSETCSGYPGDSPMDKAMAFLIDNRVRRITTCGTELFRSRLFVRQPFMDADFMNVISTLPHRWRKRHRFYLDVMRQFAPVSAASPYQRTMLPAATPYWANWLSLAAQRGLGEMASRLGFSNPFPGKSPSDFSSWFRSALRPYVEGVLLSEMSLDRGVIPADVIREAVEEHMKGEKNLTSLIGAMLSLELFCRLFLDDLQGSIDRHSTSLFN